MIELKISCEPDALDAHMASLGFIRHVNTQAFYPTKDMSPPKGETVTYADFRAGDKKAVLTEQYPEMFKDAEKPSIVPENWRELVKNVEIDTSSAEAEPDDESAIEAVHVEQASVDPIVEGIKPVGREPGKPGPGRQRRTKAEIAEDEAYFAAQTQHTIIGGDVVEVQTTPNISTGEARIDPQDAADEAAETEATKGDKLTLDDVRAAFKRYSDIVGTAIAVTQIRSILGAPIAEIPVTHEALSEAIAKIDAAIARGKQPDKLTTFVEEVKTEAMGAGGLFGVDEPKATEPVSTEPPKQARFFAQLQNLPVQKKAKAAASLAVKAYALKFDGRDDDMALMPNLTADLPRILSALFEGVRTPKDIPQTEEAFGKVCAAFQIALQIDPFERGAKR